MEDSKRRRRRHDVELKAKVLAACGEPGASVAQIALEHALNANLVHKWRRQAASDAHTPRTREGTTFIPLGLVPRLEPVSNDIRLELRRGAVTISVTWPLAAARDNAAWLREFLK